VAPLPIYFDALKELGYDIHFLSGAPEEIIKPFADYLQVESHHALRLPKTKTLKRYTGGPPYHGYVMTSGTKKQTYEKKIQPE
jgi:phosphoserine phosphatase